jgi:hypothetical protein
MTNSFIISTTTDRQHKLCKSKTFMSHFPTHFPKNPSLQLLMNVLFPLYQTSPCDTI